ncbi:MAG: hypothetical protein ABIF71_12595 [Planctomycetota bacterium]
MVPDYRGRFQPFDNARMRTYPLASRGNKVGLADSVDCARLRAAPPARESADVAEIAGHIVACRRAGRPVILMSGAHPIKNGLGPIIIDLIERGLVTLYATNGASTIHTFELALTGASSEDVRKALPRGEFGMAFETCVYINQALTEAHAMGIGYGEAMGRLVEDAGFRKRVLDAVFKRFPDDPAYLKPYDGFPYADVSVFARALRRGVPATVHASIGTDIIDQHANFDPAAKGATSGRDFLIYTEEIAKCTAGGVVLNIGSAVMGPEVFLKAVSMAANMGRTPDKLYAANFDIRPFVFDDNSRDESQYYYYLRDQKSIATRIPRVFNGKGYYVQGDHRETLPLLYQYIMRAWEA